MKKIVTICLIALIFYSCCDNSTCDGRSAFRSKDLYRVIRNYTRNHVIDNPWNYDTIFWLVFTSVCEDSGRDTVVMIKPSLSSYDVLPGTESLAGACQVGAHIVEVIYRGIDSLPYIDTAALSMKIESYGSEPLRSGEDGEIWYWFTRGEGHRYGNIYREYRISTQGHLTLLRENREASE